MSFRNKRFNAALLVVTMGLALTACQKKYTDPPILGNPDIVANITIKDIKARYSSGAPVKINDDAVIEGIVAEAVARLPLHHPARPDGPPPRAELEEDCS